MSHSPNAVNLSVYSAPKLNSQINALEKESIKDNWRNEDLIDFYEKIPLNIFRDFAIAGGFEEGCDVDLVYPYIADVGSVLDLGAGYGRVTKRLIKNGYQGEINIVERSNELCKYLTD